MKQIFGGLNGYSAGKFISMRNAPFEYGGFSYYTDSARRIHISNCGECNKFLVYIQFWSDSSVIVNLNAYKNHNILDV